MSPAAEVAAPNQDAASAAQREIANDDDIWVETLEFDDDLCGFRLDGLADMEGTDRVLQDVDPPEQLHWVYIVAPISTYHVARWAAVIPEDLYGWFQADIERFIETMTVSTN